MSHPYQKQGPRAFWSRAVARGFSAAETIQGTDFLIRKSDKVVSAGSCFASNIVPYLDRSGLCYHRTETRPTAFFEAEKEALGYPNFSAAYGNIYTVRQLLQLIRRATGTWRAAEDRWHAGGWVIDPFRPGLRYAARSDEEFDALTKGHLAATLQAFATADVFVFTLGLTEAWTSRQDGAVYPACPGTIRGTTDNIVCGTFDADAHVFHNFTVAEVTDDLSLVIAELRAINPRVRIVLTVSPVPLVATATDQHVLCASTYSKSVLRVAAQQAAETAADVTYFPAYEIVTGPQAPDSFFQPDRREVTAEAVDAVMAALLSRCEVESGDVPAPAPAPEARLSGLIANADCEELMADR